MKENVFIFFQENLLISILLDLVLCMMHTFSEHQGYNFLSSIKFYSHSKQHFSMLNACKSFKTPHSTSIYNSRSVHIWRREAIAVLKMVFFLGIVDMPFLLTPYNNQQNGAQGKYNQAHSKAGSQIERTFGRLKRRLHVLHLEVGKFKGHDIKKFA